MMKLITFFGSLIILSGCIKTADQLQREKRFETMSQQVGDTQGLMADIVAQLKDMQGQLNKMNGRIEEVEYKQKQIDPENIKTSNENIQLIKSQQEAMTSQLTLLQQELKDQKVFLSKVTESLENRAGSKSTKSKADKKKSARSELEVALNLVKENKYAQARAELEALINDDHLSPGDQNKVLHGLGRVEYFSGHPEKSLVYFSKIITKFPKATLAPSSLLFIGKALKKLGKTDEAREAFSKLSEEYKNSKEADEARKQL